MKPNYTYIWQAGCAPVQDDNAFEDMENAAMRTAWDAECAKVQAPARISYADLAFVTSLAGFVKLFEDCLLFDDAGLTMQRRA